MYCAKCGTSNDEDSMFCVKCGTDISEYAKKDVKVSKKFDRLTFKNGKILKIVATIFALLILLSMMIIFTQYNNKNENSINGTQGEYIVDVSISSIPSDANVYINNIPKGKTPITISLPEGKYDLKMNITGYKSIITGLDITSEMYRRDVNVEFEPIDYDNNSINSSI